MMPKRLRRESLRRTGVRDVARIAGVSPATVSRVLNHSSLVNAETRIRIQAVLDRVSYVRDGIARSLTSRRSGTLAVIVPAIGNSVYSEAVDAIEKRLQQAQYHLLVTSNGYDPEREHLLAKALIERGVDGLILVGNDHVPELYDLLDRSATPAIQTFTDNPVSRLPSVGFSNDTPMKGLVDYVVSLGHLEFGILHSPIRNNDRIATRLRSILEALAARGLTVSPMRVIEAGYTIAEGRSGMRALLQQGSGISAVVCTGDVLAVGAVLETTNAGISVPKEISITGFHDYELAAQIEPPLTTVHAPIREMGISAAEFLISSLAGENPSRIRELPTAMIVRRSTGPAPTRQKG